MSRIFSLKSRVGDVIQLVQKEIFFTDVSNLNLDFYKNVEKKGFFLKNINMYYDFFFLSLSLFFFKKNIFLLNFFLFKNFKNFFNYFYVSTSVGNNFVVIDNDFRVYSPFLHLSYNEAFLIRYNSFLKKNHFFLKQSYSVVLLKRFFYKTNTKTIVILNYDDFYKQLPLYATFNAAVVSFVLPNTRILFLDFFLLKSSKFFELEKLIFLSKIYNVYSIAWNILIFTNFIVYKNTLNKVLFLLK